jgi:dynein heavy chain
LDHKRIEMQRKKKEREDLLITITHQKREAEKEEKRMKEKSDIISTDKEETEKLQAEANKELEKALPAWNDAKVKIELLDKGAIAVLKTLLKNKDPRLEIIMSAVMVIMNEDTSWSNVQKVVASADFLKTLKDVKKDEIRGQRILKLEKYTQKKLVNEGNLKDYSEHVDTIFGYVRAIEIFAKINRDIEPKKKKVAQLTENLRLKLMELAELEESLNRTKAQIEELNTQFEALSEEFEVFQAEFTGLEARLDRAEKLVLGLSNSKGSWEIAKKRFEVQKSTIDGNTLMEAAFGSYFGPFPSEYREELTREVLFAGIKKTKILYSQDWKFDTYGASELDI